MKLVALEALCKKGFPKQLSAYFSCVGGRDEVRNIYYKAFSN